MGDKVATWEKSGTVRMDHAIGVTVDDQWQGKIYDNGCKPTGEINQQAKRCY